MTIALRQVGLCRYYNEMATAALQVLHIATLAPACRSALLKSSVSESALQKDAISVLLSAAEGQAFLLDPEVQQLDPISQVVIMTMLHFKSQIESWRHPVYQSNICKSDPGSWT